MTGGLVSGLTWDSLGPAATYSISALFGLIGLAVILVGWRHSGQSDGR